MGCWGPGLYQDDDAADLKNSISLLEKMPASGDAILEILVANRDTAPNFNHEGGPAFWLVVADQFEKRGIECAQVVKRALAAISGGADLRDQRSCGLPESAVKKRAKVLKQLEERLRSPRPLRPRPKTKRPPAMLVQPGDVFVFPTMRGECINPHLPEATHSWSGYSPFTRSGWGTLLVLTVGRAYDWFPWCAYKSLATPSRRKPTLDDARHARLLIANDNAADLGIPKRVHLRRMSMTPLGRLPVDPDKVNSRIGFKYTPEFAVYAGWSMSGVSWQDDTPFRGGIPVSDLLAEA